MRVAYQRCSGSERYVALNELYCGVSNKILYPLSKYAPANDQDSRCSGLAQQLLGKSPEILVCPNVLADARNHASK